MVGQGASLNTANKGGEGGRPSGWEAGGSPSGRSGQAEPRVE